MRLSGRRLLPDLVAAVIAAVWAMTVAGPHLRGQASFVDPLEAALMNLRDSTLGAIASPQEVVIVAIDDPTMAESSPLGQGRGKLADIVDGIADAGASVLAVDILLTDAGSVQGDAELAVALGRLPSVIAAAGSVAQTTVPNGIPATEAELWPQSAFSEAADIGIVNISTDYAGVPRHIPVVFMTSRGLQPSLAAQTAAIFSHQALTLSPETLHIGDRQIPLDLGFQMPLRLAGPAGTIRTISATQILNGSASADLSGKAVMLGVTATGLGDRFQTPLDPELPGVEIIATAVAQMIEGQPLRRDSLIRRIDVVAAVTLAVLCALATLTLPLASGFSVAAGTIMIWIAIVWLAFPFGIWLNAALPLACAGPPLSVATMLRYAHDRYLEAKAGRALTELKRFQSPQLAERIAENPDFLRAPESRNLVVCFVDLSGFTLISQELGPERSEAFLSRFHALLARIVQDSDGVILNLMGDGALLAYGVFDVSPRSDDALKAAVQIVLETRTLGADEGFGSPLGCRVGLHWGPVVLSRMGGNRQQQLTITGDSVNLCSRLLEIAKTQSAQIVATADFIVSLSDPLTLPADGSVTIPLRGRQGNVDLQYWRL